MATSPRTSAPVADLGPYCPICQERRCRARRDGGYFSTCYACRNLEPQPPAPAPPQAARLAAPPPDELERLRLADRRAHHRVRTNQPAPAQLVEIQVAAWLAVTDDGDQHRVICFEDVTGWRGVRYICSCHFVGGFPCAAVLAVMQEQAADETSEYYAAG